VVWRIEKIEETIEIRKTKHTAYSRANEEAGKARGKKRKSHRIKNAHTQT